MDTTKDDFGFAIFEAVCGVTGDFGLEDATCCGAELRCAGYVEPLPCTRRPGHPGDHVAGHTDGYALARWPDEVIA